MSSSKKCFANCHLSPAEFGFWEVCRSLSHKFKGKLIFDGRTIAGYFAQGTNKSVAYRLARELCTKGWFVRTKKSKRGKDGLWDGTEYQVLSHAEWTAKHGVNHCSPVRENGQDQSARTDQSSPEIENSPVRKSGHSTENTSLLRKDPSEKKALLMDAVPNGILDGLESEILSCPSHRPTSPADNVSTDMPAPIKLGGNAPDGRSWQGWEQRRQELLAHSVHAPANTRERTQ